MPSLSDTRVPVRPARGDSPEDSRWRRELSDAIRDPRELCDAVDLPTELADAASTKDFPLIAPRPFVQRMKKGDPADPLLRQVLPLGAERRDEGLPADAVGDAAASRTAGLIHKYAGRALLIFAGDCAINCRYCFRRHFPYGSAPRSEAAWEPALATLREDESITEVILSGGDPLVNSDRRIGRLVDQLGEIAHLRTLRIHTRLPVVIPSRVTASLTNVLQTTQLKPVVVLHINHANEIDSHVAAAASRLSEAGGTLLNQSVLLKGVNDSLTALTQLSERLLQIGVLPYYLHQLDRVAGVTHFEVPIEQGKSLIDAMRDSMPGYLVPRYVQEVAGEPSKQVIR